MKQKFAHIIIGLLWACNLAAQTTVTGTVTDGRTPLPAANVFIVGTIDGCLTDTLGRFSFKTTQTGEVTLKVTYMGYDDYTRTAPVSTLKDIDVRLQERATAISEVVVTASTYSFGKSDGFKTMDALDVVMSGNSCGDVVAALQSLPGTQKVGEDGKLYVRGGESDECQTFVNGMHVLVPYSTNTENTAVRGRFSPFLFKGINFTLGGYGGEYGQALSAVLPMETTLRTNGKPVAIVLGGTNPHIELISQLKARGYFVVLVDYLDNPPAKAHADIHDQTSTMDLDAVTEVARRYDASLVMSACVDQANITACYVAEQLGLTKPYSYDTASRITNKGIMKQMMSQYGIPTTKYLYLENSETEPELDLTYPVMVKPADSCASSGVKKARNHDELHT
ncbi:MAG: carboxypeptidase-like regulatory domain-containing protein, partial [Prevotella sp.]|nr:carboxypeptidase-like regulatory domain-containing protein [Prevotella sp.]